MSVTIPSVSVVCTAVSVLLCFGLPLALGIAVCRRRRGMLRPILVGAACFIIGAMVLEQLLHALVFAVFPGLRSIPAAYLLYGCLAAGVFEETARLIGLRLLNRGGSTAATGFAYGVGHGGAEAILLIGLTVLSNLMIMVTVNANGAGAVTAGLAADAAAQVEAQLGQLAALPGWYFLLSGIERVLAIALHIALSMLIWMVVAGRLPGYFYPVSILLHAVANVPAALYQLGLLPILASEGLTAVLNVLIALAVYRLYKKTAPATE